MRFVLFCSVLHAVNIWLVVSFLDRQSETFTSQSRLAPPPPIGANWLRALVVSKQLRQILPARQILFDSLAIELTCVHSLITSQPS